jgi:hypothetical protein
MSFEFAKYRIGYIVGDNVNYSARSVLSGLFVSQKPATVNKVNIEHWWLKYAAYESPGIFWRRNILTIGILSLNEEVSR